MYNSMRKVQSETKYQVGDVSNIKIKVFGNKAVTLTFASLSKRS